MADGDDDVPPLEDMSEELEQLKTRSTQSRPTQKPKVTKVATVAKATNKQQDKQSETFGGFKKGFLFGGSEPTSKKQPSPKRKSTTKPASNASAPKKASPVAPKSDEDIPYVKPKSKASGLELPEVQEAMKETFPFLEKNDWVTEDLLSKVENHPNLSKVFQDPNLTKVLLEFQKDPKAALEAAKDNREMQGFLQDFCALMGDHFTAMADEDDKMKAAAAKGEAPLITEVTEPSEEEKMREVLSNPEVKAVLEDKDIQKLIYLLKSDPDSAHKMSRSASPEVQQKIKLLIQHGLLATQP